MPFPNQPPAGPVQGLSAAQPPQAPQAPHDPKVIAATILKAAVSQFGPGIIQALKELLDNMNMGGQTPNAVPTEPAGQGIAGPGMMRG